MKTLSVGLILAISGGLAMCAGQAKAPPSPQTRAAGAKLAPVAVDPAVVSSRASRRVARSLDDSDRNSVLGVVLLMTLQRDAKAR